MMDQYIVMLQQVNPSFECKLFRMKIPLVALKATSEEAVRVWAHGRSVHGKLRSPGKSSRLACVSILTRFAENLIRTAPPRTLGVKHHLLAKNHASRNEFNEL